MLDKAFIILAVWFPLSMVVALLVGAALKFREPHLRDFTPPVWDEPDFDDVSEVEAEEMFVYVPSWIQ